LLGVRFNERILGGEGETSKKKGMKELKRRSAVTQPTVWIGRNGVTKALLNQISAQLDANEIIKIKVHKLSLEDSEVAEIAGRIADETGSQIVDTRGRTFSVYRQAKKGGRFTK
jgi:RNA-binding protein